MKNRVLNVFFHWLPLGGAIVAAFLFTYVAVQQNYRQSLNDPQVQMVVDAQAKLLAGLQPAEIIPREERFDVGSSLKPFIAIIDRDGTPLESSASVNGVPPRVPVGVLQAAKAKGENRVTWQPARGTRIALVVRPGTSESGWSVIAGRNMRDIELREEILGITMSFMLGMTLILTFALDFLGDAWRRRMTK